MIFLFSLLVLLVLASLIICFCGLRPSALPAQGWTTLETIVCFSPWTVFENKVTELKARYLAAEGSGNVLTTERRDIGYRPAISRVPYYISPLLVV